MLTSQHYEITGTLHYNSEDRGFDSRWCHCNFPLTYSSPPHCGPGVDSTSKRNEYLGDKGGRYVGLSTLTPSYADCLEMWEPKGLSRPLTGLLYLHLYLYIITSVLKSYMEMTPVNIMTSIHHKKCSYKNSS